MLILIFFIGVKDDLDVLPLQEALHAIQEVVVQKVVKGRVVLDGFLVKGREGLHGGKREVVGEGRLVGCDVLLDSLDVHSCNGLLSNL